MKALIYYNNMYEGEGYEEVTAHRVDVPHGKAFAAKKGKYWYVYELGTGLRLTCHHKTKALAVQEATDTLNAQGADGLHKALEGRKIVNNYDN